MKCNSKMKNYDPFKDYFKTSFPMNGSEYFVARFFQKNILMASSIRNDQKYLL